MTTSRLCTQQVFGTECDCRFCMAQRAKRQVGGPSKDRKQTVLDRDDCKCHYCGGHATTVDHVIPRSKGGTNALSNLVAACHWCNSAKGDQIVTSDWVPPPRPVVHPVAKVAEPRSFRKVFRLGERVLYWRPGGGA